MADMNPALAIVDSANPKRGRALRLLAGVVVIAALVATAWWALFQRGRVETDNAYVGGETALVTPQLPGTVTEVMVGGTQAVNAGDVLVVLDDADARIAVAQAEAALAQARQRYGQAGALAEAATARAAGRTADIAAARSRLTEAEAMLARVKAEFDRRQTLAGSGAVSNEELGAARAALAAAVATRDAARTAVASAQDTARSAAGDAAAAAALVRGTTISTAPDIRAAEATLARARLDLDRTVIKAPVAGIVTNRNVQVGQRVAGGAPLMTLVPTAGLFVDANFKESQLERIRVGQTVELTSDLYGGNVRYTGKVVGLAGGTGAAFSLIPAQNATGNWVKVVQRLPVRIALDEAEVKANPLRVGLSMTAVVDTRE
ncbi:HlyD family efflux transporter periplasmic adaptor subunit [Sandarakinorhabdus sp.]|uniref:HlyD family efflux transporter periplasmic adaptor subunit n=1 Tax=Sandarakinorhabdus sp. TaxID=1916663 RepID=UPI00286E0DE7|nr:HlyD family efflux transporter periplasmic adaptor subunit [Sandarakinorhabdus sp.]